MKKKKEIRDELEGLSPFLREQKSQPEGYDVPKDYFKSLPDEVLGKLANPMQPTVAAKETQWLDRVTHFIQYLFQPRYALAYAAVALLVVAGIYLTGPDQNRQPSNALAMLNELSDETLTEYVFENIDEFEESTLTEQLAENIDPLSRLLIENSDELMDELIEDLNEEDLEALEELL